MPPSFIGPLPLIITPGFHQVVSAALVADGVTPQYERAIDSISIVKSIVLHGRHCSFFPSGFVRDEVKQGSLKALHVQPHPVYRDIVSAVKADRPLPLAVKSVRALAGQPEANPHGTRSYMHVLHNVFAPVYQPDDIYTGTLATLLAALNGGITTVCDNMHNARSQAHSDAAKRR